VKKSLLVFSALAIATSGAALADGIASPTTGQVIFSDDVMLLGSYDAAASVQWAFRRYDGGTCAAGAGLVNNIAGNVDGMADTYDLDNGQFEAMLDLTGLSAGTYCAVLNFTSAGGPRYMQTFYVVDQYAKVSGRVDDPFITDSKGRKAPVYTFSGVLGLAGSAGTVGSVTVNYKQLGDVCEFTGGTLSFPANGKAYYANSTRTCSSGLTGTADLAIYDNMWPSDPLTAFCRNATGRGCLGVSDSGGVLTAPYRLSESLADGEGATGTYQYYSADIDAGNGIVVH